MLFVYSLDVVVTVSVLGTFFSLKLLHSGRLCRYVSCPRSSPRNTGIFIDPKPRILVIWGIGDENEHGTTRTCIKGPLHLDDISVRWTYSENQCIRHRLGEIVLVKMSTRVLTYTYSPCSWYQTSLSLSIYLNSTGRRNCPRLPVIESCCRTDLHVPNRNWGGSRDKYHESWIQHVLLYWIGLRVLSAVGMG